MAENGIENASLTILGGYFDILSYCVAPPDPSGRAVIAYTKPIDAGAAWLVFGNATLGRSIRASRSCIAMPPCGLRRVWSKAAIC